MLYRAILFLPYRLLGSWPATVPRELCAIPNKTNVKEMLIQGNQTCLGFGHLYHATRAVENDKNYTF